MRGLLFLVVFVTVLSGCVTEEQASERVCFEEGPCISVDVASTPEKRVRGLMYREYLEEGTGMLFPFDYEGEHGIWMKNMRFPIDIIWISEEGEVVHVERSAPPCEKEPCKTYLSREEALYVLETRANLTLKEGIEKGSHATIYTS